MNSSNGSAAPGRPSDALDDDPPGAFADSGPPLDAGADADLGDIVVILLVSTLAGLRDRLHADGFEGAASLVHDLVEVADDYVMRLSRDG
jgi:hypothetical protein